MKNLRLLLLSALASVVMSSCADETIYNTWHPDKAMVTIITDWSNSSPGAWSEIPYTIKFGQGTNLTTYTSNGLVKEMPLMESGLYNIEIVSNGPGFSVNGNIATLDESKPGFVVSNPAYLFTARTSVEASIDRNTIVKIPMIQQMRPLVLRVYLKNDPTIYTEENPSGFKRPVKTIRATMTGFANKMNFIDDTYQGTYSVELPFVVRNSKTEGRYLECTLVMLGVNGDDQTMHLELDFEYGENIRPSDRNFHTELIDFNATKYIPDTIKAEIKLPINVTGGTTIEDYVPVSMGDEDVSESDIAYALGDIYPKHDQTRPQGVVVWTTPDGKHGMVMSGYESELEEETNITTRLVSWGPTADITGTMHTMGIRCTAAISTYVDTNEAGYSLSSFGALEWLIGKYTNVTTWFIPSSAEINFLSSNFDTPQKLADMNAKLSSVAGFTTIDENDILWTSQTKKGALKPSDMWGDQNVPEYYPATIYTWNYAREVRDTAAVYANPDYIPGYNPDAPDADPDYDPSTPATLPVKLKARAFRFF